MYVVLRRRHKLLLNNLTHIVEASRVGHMLALSRADSRRQSVCQTLDLTPQTVYM